MSQSAPTQRQKILFICGSLNQTTQMHQIARELGEYDHAFTPFYGHGAIEALRRARCLEFTVLGYKLRRRCLDYLERHRLPIDFHGRSGGYDLVVTCSDLIVPRNIRKMPVVLVQEGILDPAGIPFLLCRKLRILPLWLAGTSTTGLSGRYQRFCVASDGYRDLFVRNGALAERIAVTGIPNFDDCGRFHCNEFPYRGFVLVCSSDARETFKRDDRRAFIQRCLDVAAGRRLIFKLHPNENAERATREIHELAPSALVYATGCAEEMIANCDVLITQYSSTVFVGVALGKEVYSYFDLAEVRRLLPLQNRSAARNIAAVCRELLAADEPAAARPRLPLLQAGALLRLSRPRRAAAAARAALSEPGALSQPGAPSEPGAARHGGTSRALSLLARPPRRPRRSPSWHSPRSRRP
ncbi:MAG TPA: hypothetical protein VHR45_01280 [Thermoanaerobaculia bacterium]|nr:hypothetical protein [Thermoanaerobaculia bacterium]